MRVFLISCEGIGCGNVPEVLSILGDLLPVQFERVHCSAAVSAEIVVDGEDRPILRRNSEPVPRLTVPAIRVTQPEDDVKEIHVRFADDADVPFPFRGRSIGTKVGREIGPLVRRDTEKVLASTDIGPLWVVSGESTAKHYRSNLALPTSVGDNSLRDVLNGERFFEMLPLLHFLREVCGSSAFNGPPLRACFIFDDPNLHWHRYGFVDFRQIAGRARKENYHVSFATIPLDFWFTHQATADVFRRNAETLSLVVHGNNHTKLELARNYTRSARRALLNQAIRRIEILERRTHLRVSRVMVPPYGACSEEMLAELPGCGFEAASISHGSLLAHNRRNHWTKTLGYLPSETIQGCPVLPRWGFSASSANTVLLAAFLRQPIVLRGHHQDLRHGIELLDEHARFINGLGRVSWSNMTRICRANYQWRMDADILTVKPLGRKSIVDLPHEVQWVVVEDTAKGALENWQLAGKNGATFRFESGVPIRIPRGIDGKIALEAIADPSACAADTSRPPSPAWAILRRALTETRDRVFGSW